MRSSATSNQSERMADDPSSSSSSGMVQVRVENGLSDPEDGSRHIPTLRFTPRVRSEVVDTDRWASHVYSCVM